ncbi:immunoglobulin domain-containing protein, partial [Spirosoma flavus]
MNGCTNSSQVTIDRTPPVYEGYFGTVNCTTVDGWIADRACLQRSIPYKIFIDGNLVYTGIANVDRNDVAGYLNNGNTNASTFKKYGFSFAMPDQGKVGPHTLRFTDLNGNNLIAPHTYGVSSIPRASQDGNYNNTTGVSVCKGTAASLKADNCSGTVRWYVGSSLKGTGNPFNTGPLQTQTTYNARCTDAGGCESVNSNPYTISILALPNNIHYTWILDPITWNPTTTSAYTICEGVQIGFGSNANNASNIQTQWWVRPDGTTFSVDNNQNWEGEPQLGTYTYWIRDMNGCTNSSQVTIDRTPPVYEGYFGTVNCTTVDGWIADRACLQRSIPYKIFIDGNLVYTGIANVDRNDVAGYLNNGNTNASTFKKYGFSFAMPDQGKVGPHTLRFTDLNGNNLIAPRPYGVNAPGVFVFAPGQIARVGNSYTICEGSGLGLGLDSNAPGTTTWSGPGLAPQAPNVDFPIMDASKQGVYTYKAATADGCSNATSVTVTVAPGQYEAAVEELDCNHIKGWLVNHLCHNQQPVLQIKIDGNVVATLRMDQARPTIKAQKAADANHDLFGFNWAIPAQYRVGPHTLRITDLGDHDLIAPRPYGVNALTAYLFVPGQIARVGNSYTICEGSGLG